MLRVDDEPSDEPLIWSFKQIIMKLYSLHLNVITALVLVDH